MWEVQAVSRTTGQERRVVTTRWERASELAQRALDRNWTVKIKRYWTDVLIADPSGDFMIVASRVDPREAARWTTGYARVDRRRGCVLWPHGRPLPDSWRVVG